VRGTVRLEDASEAIGVSLEHPDVQTISGLVLTLLAGPAVQGEVVTWNYVRIEVTAQKGRGVSEAVLTRLGGPSRPQHGRELRKNE
jgi:CBS domain containing-hemolysin-like protein